MEEQEHGENTDRAGLLYHYTSQKGLLGIIENRHLWVSHLQYLNDTSEGQIFAKLLINELDQRDSAESKEPLSRFMMLAQLMGRSVGEPETKMQHADKKVLSTGRVAFSWIKAQDAFVASFSEQGDLLSQWRAYSGETGGYSIGFTRSYLKSVGVRFLENRRDSFHNDSNPLVACRYCDNQKKIP